MLRETFKGNYLDVEGKRRPLCERAVSHAKSGGKSILGRGNGVCKGHDPENQAREYRAGLSKLRHAVQMWSVN